MGTEFVNGEYLPGEARKILIVIFAGQLVC